MSKPTVKHAKHHAKLSEEIRSLKAEWQAWLKAGLPAREPLTKHEVQRRIVLLGRVQAVLDR